MKTTLEQWRMFRAVVEHGGYAQAAEAIFKSQSTISYGVHKLQEQLGVQLLEVEGRKAVLTEHGRILLQRANQLLDQAENLDAIASSLSSGIEAKVRLALDMIYPYDQLFDVLEEFSRSFPDTRIELEEYVLSGGIDMLEEGSIDLLISPTVPKGWHGQHIERARFCPVTTPTIRCSNWAATSLTTTSPSIARWCCAIPAANNAPTPAGWARTSAGPLHTAAPA